jgi:hypothetical protein
MFKATQIRSIVISKIKKMSEFKSNLKISCINITNSFFLDCFLFDAKSLKQLELSIKKHGIQTPILLYKDAHKILHLADGFQRIKYASKDITYHICADLEKVLDIILQNNKVKITNSLASKIYFIKKLQELKIPKKTIQAYFLPALSLDNHEVMLPKYLKISKLSLQVLQFCAEKQLSLKQCLHLLNLPQNLLLTILSWQAEINLTLSIILELVENINDYLRGQNSTLAQFLKTKAFSVIMSSDLSNHEKTAQLRVYVKQLRFPILTQTNAKLAKIKQRLNLPSNLNLTWDQTLENKAVNLQVKLISTDEVKDIVTYLTKQNTKIGINEILDEL